MHSRFVRPCNPVDWRHPVFGPSPRRARGLPHMRCPLPWPPRLRDELVACGLCAGGWRWRRWATRRSPWMHPFGYTTSLPPQRLLCLRVAGLLAPSAPPSPPPRSQACMQALRASRWQQLPGRQHAPRLRAAAEALPRSCFCPHAHQTACTAVLFAQFIKAMRDSDGAMMHNAHILGFFRRHARRAAPRARSRLVSACTGLASLTPKPNWVRSHARRLLAC